MSPDDDFNDLMARLQTDDQAAETIVFRRFVHRLIALAGRQFESGVGDRADVEDAVLSACKSFFLRNRRGEFELATWEDLWSLLALITVRKCGRRRKHLRALKRDAGREIRWSNDAVAAPWLQDRAPTPLEAAILAETVEQLFQAMTPADRPIVEQILAGYTAEEIAARLDCSERTVRRVRQRAKMRLRRVVGAESHEEEVA